MDAIDLAFAGLARQAQLVRDRTVSAVELTDVVLDRIAAHEPQLNAFRVVFADAARAAAQDADRRIAAGEQAPLLGVPVAIKDDCDVSGERTCRGSNAVDIPAAADAELVRRLRAAGAIVVGKTNVPELMIWPFTESATFGVTRNPWDLQRTPGGSSGGTGAALAAGLIGGALGSDGGGSIRIPAGCCGLFGLKPQRDRVPLAPHKECWRGLSVFGPLARNVTDAALFLDVVAGTGETFQTAAATPPAEPLRIAVSYALPSLVMGRLDDEQRGAVQQLAEQLRGLGHQVTEHELDYRPDQIPAFAVRWLRGIADDAELLDHPDRLGQRARSMARLGRLLPAALVDRVRAAEPGMAVRLGAAFDTHDVVVTPMFTHRPLRIGECEGMGVLRTFDVVSRWVPFCANFNVTGQPAAAVPAGFATDGFPLSAQLVGRPGDEATLLSLAAQLQADRDWAERRPPRFGS